MRYIFISLIFGMTSFNNNSCEQPGQPDFSQSLVVTFEHAHDVVHSKDGVVKAADELLVWKRQPDEICFFLTTVSNEYNTCFLSGKASKETNINYRYQEKSCQVVFKLEGDLANVQVTGPDGAGFCKPDDLEEGGACGFNTSIGTATYRRLKNQLPNQEVETESPKGAAPHPLV